MRATRSGGAPLGGAAAVGPLASPLGTLLGALLGALIVATGMTSARADDRMSGSVRPEKVWVDWCGPTLFVTSNDRRIERAVDPRSGGSVGNQRGLVLDLDDRPGLRAIEPLPSERGSSICWLAPQPDPGSPTLTSPKINCHAELDGRELFATRRSITERLRRLPTTTWLVEYEGGRSALVVGVRGTDNLGREVSDVFLAIFDRDTTGPGARGSMPWGGPGPLPCEIARPSSALTVPSAPSAPPVRASDPAAKSVGGFPPQRPLCGVDRGSPSTVLVWLETDDEADRDALSLAESIVGQALTDGGVQITDRASVQPLRGVKDVFAIPPKLATRAGLRYALAGSIGAWTSGAIMNTQMIRAYAAASLRLIDLRSGRAVVIRQEIGTVSHIDPEKGRLMALKKVAKAATKAVLAAARQPSCP